MLGVEESVLWALLITATVTDLVCGKIFNWMVFPAIALAFAYRFWFEGAASIHEVGVAVLAAFLFFYPLFLLKALAAGDAKLLMALGAWSNWKFVVLLGASSIVIGAFAGGLILLRKQGLRGSLVSVGNHLGKSPSSPSHRVPFAPAFLCAFLFLKTAAMCQWHLF